MDRNLALDIFWIEAYHILALIFSITINGILFRRAEKSPLRARYLWVQACVLLWIISKILKTISPDSDWRWFFVVTQYIGVSFLGTAFFLFAFHFVKRRDPRPAFTASLIIGSLSCLIIVATNPAHHLFYASFNFYRDTFGPLFLYTMIFQYIQVLAALLLLMHRIILNRRFAAQDRLIGLAALLPLSVNILYVAGIIQPMFDITPIAMTLVLLLFAVAAFRFKFLGVIPLAHQMISTGLKDPVLVFNPEGNLTSPELINKEMRAVRKRHDFEVGAVLAAGERFYRLENLQLLRKWRFEHWVDISGLRRLEHEKVLAVKQLEELEQEIRRRNITLLATAETEAMRHARLELHDIIGHSLIQVMILLRTVRLAPGRVSVSARETLLRAREACRDSVNQVSRISELPRSENLLLSSQLYGLAEVFVGSPVHFQILIRGIERRLPTEICQVLVRCSQEAATNAVKHGRPEEITIVAMFGRDGILMLIVDDGIGCEGVVPGFGLAGMAERTNRVGGTLRYQSEPGEGMQISIWIPN